MNLKILRQRLTSFPPYIFSGMVVIAILWLTLSPHPLGENPPPIFPGADKIAHAIMFGALTAMLLLDFQRKHFWERIGLGRSILYAIGVSAFGAFTEIAQNLMEMGREFEVADIISDSCGAVVIAILWVWLQKFWVPIAPE